MSVPECEFPDRSDVVELTVAHPAQAPARPHSVIAELLVIDGEGVVEGARREPNLTKSDQTLDLINFSVYEDNVQEYDSGSTKPILFMERTGIEP